MKETEGGPKSIEELKAAQEAHSAQAREDRERAEKEAEEQRRLEEAAGEDYRGGRQDTLDEIRQVRAEADQMEAENIRERKAQAEKLRGDAVEKREALEALQTEISSAKERVQAIGEIIKGVSEEEVASEVRENFAAAQREHSTLIAQAQQLDGEISQLEDQIPSNEQVQKYEGLLAKLSELDGRMAEIESNPALVELIMKEAKSENEQRDRVIHAVLTEAARHSHAAGRHDKRARELGKQIGETFISEVLANSGVDEIKDPAERQRRVYVILSEMFAGVTTVHQTFGYEHIAREGDREKQRNMFSGLVLLNLLGGFGTLGGTLGFLDSSETRVRLGEIDDGRRDRWPAQARAVAGHINSLNLIRAYSQGLKGHRHLDEFIHGFGAWQNDFDSRVTSGGENGIDAWDGQPIVPRSASPEEKTRIKERFEAEKAKAEALEKTLTEEDEKTKQEDIQKLEGAIAQIDEGIQSCQEAIALNKGNMPTAQDLAGREAGLESLRAEQPRVEREIENMEEDRRHLGLFARGEKRDLDGRISQKRARLGFLRINIPRFEQDAAKIREALTILNANKARTEWDLRNRRANLVQSLERVKRGY